MAWTTPRTWVVGETPTAAIMNAHLRDNLNFLYSAPSCRVYNSANISIPNDTMTDLTFNSERWDNDTMHSTVSNTGRITFTTAGRYLLISNVEFAANATGYRLVRISHSVSADIAQERLPEVSASTNTVLIAGTLWSCAAGEYAITSARQNSGGALNVLAEASFSPEWMAHWMGN